MKLKAKVLVFIVLIGVLFLSLFFLLFQVILADPIKEQKKLRARQLMEGALSVFENETKRLLTFCEKFAGWDSMYRYVSQPNQAFEQELAPRLTLRDADLSLLLVTDKKKEILLVEAYHYVKDEYIPFTLLEQKKGALWNYLEDTFNMKRSITGIVNSEYGPMLAVSSPVLRSDGSGPQNGRLLMGRFIDKTFEKKITAVIRENSHLSMDTPPQTRAPTGTRQKAAEDFMLTEEGGHMHIQHTVKDVKDRPAFTIRVDAQKQTGACRSPLFPAPGGRTSFIRRHFLFHQPAPANGKPSKRKNPTYAGTE
jgi:sensor domain CHASE-containing protein